MKLKRGTGHAEFLRLRSQDTNDCVLWPYSNSNGYGLVTVDGKQQYAHALSCEMVYGPRPTNARHEAAHSCHTPACINPRHLRWATVAENQQDRVADGTSNRGASHIAKVSEDDVREIRRLVGQGVKQVDLARRFGLSKPAVCAIVKRDNWKWVA